MVWELLAVILPPGAAVVTYLITTRKRKPIMNLDVLVQDLNPDTVKLLPGKVLIEQDPIPEKIGSLFVPGTARNQSETSHIAHTGTILAVGYGVLQWKDDVKGRCQLSICSEDYRKGDRVVYRLLMSDLNHPRIFTDVRRIDAVLDGAGRNEKL